MPYCQRQKSAPQYRVLQKKQTLAILSQNGVTVLLPVTLPNAE